MTQGTQFWRDNLSERQRTHLPARCTSKWASISKPTDVSEVRRGMEPPIFNVIACARGRRYKRARRVMLIMFSHREHNIATARCSHLAPYVAAHGLAGGHHHGHASQAFCQGYFPRGPGTEHVWWNTSSGFEVLGVSRMHLATRAPVPRLHESCVCFACLC